MVGDESNLTQSPAGFRKAFDPLIEQIADYVVAATIASAEAYETARYCLMDTLGCGLLALNYPACTKLLGPVVPGTTIPNGSRVPGTSFVLDPITAAFNIGTIIRWLDFNDTWLAAEWGHPSANLGAILAVADYVSRCSAAANLTGHNGSDRRPTTHDPRPSSDQSLLTPAPTRKQYTVRDLLIAMIQAHEIQGVLALENSFNRVGLDHVLLVRVASTAVAIRLLGRDPQQITIALSNAWLAA